MTFKHSPLAAFLSLVLLLGVASEMSLASPPPKLVAGDGLKAPVVKVGTADAVLIPLSGVAGVLPGEQFFTGTGFESTIAPLKGSTVRRAIIVLDTVGGSIATKDAIVRGILSLRADGIRTIAVVKNAAGVGGLIAVACDEVMALPGATFGGGLFLSVSEQSLFDEAKKACGEGSFVTRSWWGASEKFSAPDRDSCAATGRAVHDVQKLAESAFSTTELAKIKLCVEQRDLQSAISKASPREKPLDLGRAIVYPSQRVQRLLLRIREEQKEIDEIGGLGKSKTKSVQSSRDADRRRHEESKAELQRELAALVKLP